MLFSLDFQHGFKKPVILDEITNTIGLVIAVATLAGIAYPTILLPRLRPRKMKVGSAYWGVYKGQSTKQPDHLKTVEVNVADEATHKVVAGSAMYASGRAVGG